MGTRTLAETLTYLGQCVAFTETTQKLPCCNTCGKLETCEYRPEWGEPTRINCPLWNKDGGEQDEDD